MRAVHFFDHTADQQAIFGREEQKPEREELSGILNGLMLSKYVKGKIVMGYIVIVPQVSDPSSQEEVDAWSVSEPKAYKIRVTSTAGKGTDRHHPYTTSKVTWNDLDGREVQFGSDHRPRARYLYWQYCKTVLAMRWTEEGVPVKYLWTVKGPYMRKGMLLVIVEQLGGDPEDLMMQNTIMEIEEDNINESDPTVVLIASAEVRAAHRRHTHFEKDEDEEEDSDETSDEETS